MNNSRCLGVVNTAHGRAQAGPYLTVLIVWWYYAFDPRTVLYKKSVKYHTAFLWSIHYALTRKVYLQ